MKVRYRFLALGCQCLIRTCDDRLLDLSVFYRDEVNRIFVVDFDVGLYLLQENSLHLYRHPIFDAASQYDQLLCLCDLLDYLIDGELGISL